MTVDISLICTAGSSFTTAGAFATVHVFPSDGGTDHCPGTSDATLDFNCLDGAVEGAGATLHAPGLVDKFCCLFSFCENPVGAYLAAPPAVDTPLRIIFESILEV
jgi:hypothetical protein